MIYGQINRRQRRCLKEKVAFKNDYFYYMENGSQWLAYGNFTFKHPELCLHLGIPPQSIFSETPTRMSENGKCVIEVGIRPLSEIVQPIVEALGHRDLIKLVMECNALFEKDCTTYQKELMRYNQLRKEEKDRKVEEFMKLHTISQ